MMMSDKEGIYPPGKIYFLIHGLVAVGIPL